MPANIHDEIQRGRRYKYNDMQFLVSEPNDFKLMVISEAGFEAMVYFTGEGGGYRSSFRGVETDILTLGEAVKTSCESLLSAHDAEKEMHDFYEGLGELLQLA